MNCCDGKQLLCFIYVETPGFQPLHFAKVHFMPGVGHCHQVSMFHDHLPGFTQVIISTFKGCLPELLPPHRCTVSPAWGSAVSSWAVDNYFR